MRTAYLTQYDVPLWGASVIVCVLAYMVRFVAAAALSWGTAVGKGLCLFRLHANMFGVCDRAGRVILPSRYLLKD